MAKRTSLDLPARTSWIDVVPGADPPEDVLLVLLQEEDDGYNVQLGLYDAELDIFVGPEGTAVELGGKVTRYHILITPSGKRMNIRDDE